MLTKMIKGLQGLVKSAKIIYINRYKIQLIVPEYKGYHVCSGIEEMLKWSVCYPADCEVIVIYPSAVY